MFLDGELGARELEIGTFEYEDYEFYYDTKIYTDTGDDIPAIKWFDLDNDGKDEPYWDMYDGSVMIAIDARNGELYIIAHAGRQIYSLRKLNGKGDIVDEFDLGAEYWDEPDDRYNENSDFYYRGEKIPMEEYESLRKAYFGS